MLKIYNSLSRAEEPFVPLDPARVRMYVCGMTVYDYCHLGHARMMIVFDVVQRWFRASGYPLTYVRNITDVDDKIIRRASETGESVTALTERFIRYMDEDAAALAVQKPDIEPRATGHVTEMIQMIRRLEERGIAYRAESGDVSVPESGSRSTRPSAIHSISSCGSAPRKASPFGSRPGAMGVRAGTSSVRR